MNDPVVGLQKERITEAAKHLGEFGYAVVEGVLTPQQCEEIVSDLWDAVESLTSAWKTPVNRNQPETHRTSKFLPNMKGIIMAPSILSHCGAAWKVRKAAAPYFARLHGTPHLVSSFDRVNIMPKPVDKEAKAKNWMHTDQTPLLYGLHSIQGFIDLKGTGPNDGGLVVAAKSHLDHHDLLYHEWGIDTTDNWIPFFGKSSAHKCAWRTIHERFHVLKVECKPGSLVLWDSRTFHQNLPPKLGGHERAVIYASFQPLDCVPLDRLDRILKKRIAAFDTRRATSHIALSHVKLFAEKPRNYKRALPTYTINEQVLGVPSRHLDPIVASLVGASREPVVRWTQPHAALLTEPMIARSSMVAQRPALLKLIGKPQPKRPIQKRKREGDDEKEDTVRFHSVARLAHDAAQEHIFAVDPMAMTINDCVDPHLFDVDPMATTINDYVDLHLFDDPLASEQMVDFEQIMASL